MKPLPVEGSTIIYVRPGFATWIQTDGEFDLDFEAPMYVHDNAESYVIDPRQGNPDVDLLNQMVGKKIVKAGYTFREGLRFETDDGLVYEVPPIESYQSWTCMGNGIFYIGSPSDVFDPPDE